MFSEAHSIFFKIFERFGLSMRSRTPHLGAVAVDFLVLEILSSPLKFFNSGLDFMSFEGFFSIYMRHHV